VANEVTFILRFNTAAGEQQIRAFSAQAKSALTNALSIEPQSLDLSKAMQLKKAITELSTVQKEVDSVVKSLGVLNSTQLKALKAQVFPQQFDPNRGRSGAFVDPTTGKVASKPKGPLFEAINTAIGTAESKEEAEVIKRLFTAEITKRKLFNDLLDRRNILLKEESDLRIKQFVNPNRTKGGFFAEQFDVMRNKQKKGSVERTGSFFEDVAAIQAKSKVKADYLRRTGLKDILTFKDIRASEKSFAITQRAAWHKEFDVTGHGRASSIERMFGKKNVTREEFIENKRQEARKGSNKISSKHLNPEQALGISPTATRLLALSSVLQPLNSQLGMVAMQAGFAAFSLGAPIAALAILSAAVAGFRNLLMKSVEAAKAAGLETRKYNRATTELALEMQGFMKILGIKTQQAFVPVVKEITELFKEVEKLPWDDMISGAAEATRHLIEVTKWLSRIGSFANPILAASKGANKSQDILGLKGSQRIDFGKIFGAGFSPAKMIWESLKQGREASQKPKPETEQFVYTPKFDFSQIEDLHMRIQKSIFKQEEKDPQTKALEAQTNVIRQGFNQGHIDSIDMKKALYETNRRVPLAVAGT
jgi:hypothetical protein